MRKELQEKLVNRWPNWFHMDGNLRETLMPFGIGHGDGWFDLLWNLCEEVEPLLHNSESESFRVVQVKEKLGGLRFYTNSQNDVIRTRISASEQKSFTICEVCGEPGTLRGTSWLRTRCDKHVDAKPGLSAPIDVILDEIQCYEHRVFAEKLKELMSKAPYADRSDIRPFVCPEFPLDCKAFIVGINPATQTNCFRELFNSTDGRFDSAEFNRRYPGTPAAGVRPRLERIQTAAPTVSILQTNIWAFEAGAPDDVPQEFRNTQILQFLLSEIKPEAVLVHGNTAIEALGQLGCFDWTQPLALGFAGWVQFQPYEFVRQRVWVCASRHLRNVSYRDAESYGREIQAVCDRDFYKS